MSDNPAKFCGHRHCGSGDIMVSVCHVILRDHVIKEKCDFMGGLLMVSHTSAKFDSKRHNTSGDIMVLVCDEISQDYAIKGLHNIMGRIF